MITGIILASGFSKRMGREKLTLEVDGTPIVERVVRAVVSSKIGEVLIIYKNDAVKSIGESYGIKTVYNGFSHMGQSEAVKLGIINSNPETDGYMFFTGDQPFINKDVINILIDNFSEGQFPVIAPLYKGKRGSPVIFSAELKHKLLELEGDTGGRAVIRKMEDKVKFISINDSNAGADIDTLEEYIKITKTELMEDEE